MTQSYEIVLDGQLGQRIGTLCWTETGGQVRGVISLLGFDNPICGRREGEELELTHRLRTAVSTLDCETHIRLQDGGLSGTVRCPYRHAPVLSARHVTAVLRNQSRRFFTFTQTNDDLQGHGSRLEVILPCPFLFFAVSMICTS